MRAMRDRRELAGAWSRFQSHGFAAAHPDLSGVITRYWWARWDLRDQPDYAQLIVPYPNVQLTFTTTEPAMIRGVARGRVRRTLSGRGAVLAVTFRPGVFRRFLRAPVSSITDRAVPATRVFGPHLPPLPAATLTTTPDPAEVLPPLIESLERFLLAHRPPPDPPGDEVASWAEVIAATPALRRVDHLTAHFGPGERRLQRLFAEHVGVSPKWVLRRFRLHEVTERMAARDAAINWAVLAADLGYADQAHLIRDFTAMFGESPTSYAARY